LRALARAPRCRKSRAWIWRASRPRSRPQANTGRRPEAVLKPQAGMQVHHSRRRQRNRPRRIRPRRHRTTGRGRLPPARRSRPQLAPRTPNSRPRLLRHRPRTKRLPTVGPATGIRAQATTPVSKAPSPLSRRVPAALDHSLLPRQRPPRPSRSRPRLGRRTPSVPSRAPPFANGSARNPAAAARHRKRAIRPRLRTTTIKARDGPERVPGIRVGRIRGVAVRGIGARIARIARPIARRPGDTTGQETTMMIPALRAGGSADGAIRTPIERGAVAATATRRAPAATFGGRDATRIG
jgi:hypothetical protein